MSGISFCILCDTAQPELIDARELARRWNVPESWIREHCRKSCDNPIPHTRMGKYVRFEWGSQQLAEWHASCRNITNNKQEYAYGTTQEKIQ